MSVLVRRVGRSVVVPIDVSLVLAFDWIHFVVCSFTGFVRSAYEFVVRRVGRPVARPISWCTRSVVRFVYVGLFDSFVSKPVRLFIVRFYGLIYTPDRSAPRDPGLWGQTCLFLISNDL